MHVGAVNTWYHGVQRRTVVDPPGAAAVQFQSGTVHGSLRFSKYLSTKGTPLHAGAGMRFANACGRILKIPD